MPGQPRKPYKRFAPRVWDEHKNVIHELFIKQDKTYDEVVAILNEKHSFSIGVRQLKRKTDGWGFSKNIPARDMEKMVRERQRREEQLGQPSKFQRRQGDGTYHEVLSAKLDAYQKRFHPEPTSPRSQCSSLPSNIRCVTPSEQTQPSPKLSLSSLLDGNSPPRSSDHEQVHINGKPVPFKLSNALRQLISDTYSAQEAACDGDYSAAAQAFRLLVQTPYLREFPSIGALLLVHFNATIMEAATHPGCPRNLVTRICDILFHTVARVKSIPALQNAQHHTMLLQLLHRIAAYWTSLLVRQRALQILEPILGKEHVNIAVCRGEIEEERERISTEKKIICPDIRSTKHGSRWGILDLSHSLNAVEHLMQLCDGPMQHILERLQVVGRSPTSVQEIDEETAQTRHGRSMALLGAYYSSTGRLDHAEKALQGSHRTMMHETCVEIQLYRILWHAEHKTRVLDWDAAGRFTRQAHEIFITTDTPSNFAMEHFPKRFNLIWGAISDQVPIDKFLGGSFIDSPEYDAAHSHYAPPPPSSDLAQPGTIAGAPPPASVYSALSPQRLFPTTPTGANAEVDFEAWREFVCFSPSSQGSSGTVTCLD